VAGGRDRYGDGGGAASSEASLALGPQCRDRDRVRDGDGDRNGVGDGHRGRGGVGAVETITALRPLVGRIAQQDRSLAKQLQAAASSMALDIGDAQ
jgi:hypothetical protein